MEPVLWLNKRHKPARELLPGLDLCFSDVIDVTRRLERFTHFPSTVFPEAGGGLVESPC